MSLRRTMYTLINHCHMQMDSENLQLRREKGIIKYTMSRVWGRFERSRHQSCGLMGGSNGGRTSPGRRWRHSLQGHLHLRRGDRVITSAKGFSPGAWEMPQWLACLPHKGVPILRIHVRNAWWCDSLGRKVRVRGPESALESKNSRIRELWV